MLRQLQLLLASIRTRVANMIARGIVKVVDDAKKMQAIQLSLLEGETREGVERFQNYGFTSHPHPGAEAVVAFVGGARDHGLIVVVDDRRYRLLALAEGEVAMFDDLGSKVVLKRGGNIEVTAPTKILMTAPTIELVASTKVKIATPLLEITEDVTIGQTLTVTGNIDSDATITGTTDVVGGGKSLKNHTHPGSTLTTTATVTGSPPPGTIGGNTGAPN
jgi:phage baseplate assembly protein V